MPNRSYIPYDETCHFSIENLPYGIFSTEDDPTPRIGVAIGDSVLDLKKSVDIFEGPLLRNVQEEIFKQITLNAFMALGRPYWTEARSSIQSYLSIENQQNFKKGVFAKQSEVKMHLPVSIGDYTDFFSSYYHAYNCSLLFNIDILKSNWRHLPIAYHGRSSSVVVSETSIKRPIGQVTESITDPAPALQPTKRFDFEMEAGVFVGGDLNKLGEPLKIANIHDHIFGMVLLNDWSARDVQHWEMIPLGPFNAKNFATSISPWIVTMDALQPFKVKNMQQDPIPLPYLQHKDDYNFDIILETYLKCADQTVTKLCTSNYRHLYWTAKQQLCHHTITGCNMRAGDLMGSGTISGPTEDSAGCLMELTFNGKKPFVLSNGQMRNFLEDGDEVIMTGYCQGNGYRVGFGTCAGKVLPSN